MTNFEWLIKGKPDLAKEYLTSGKKLALVNGEITDCLAMNGCAGCECFLPIGKCNAREWLDAEHKSYTVPPDTPIDTKVLVSDGGEVWHKRHFAGFSKDTAMPYLAFSAGGTSWTHGEAEPLAWKYCKLAEGGEKQC